MRPALLIVMMDFLVASLLLYVTEPGMPKMPVTAVPATEAVSNPGESLWASVSQLERERDAEMESLYKGLLTQSNEEDLRAMREENLRLAKLMEKSQQAVEKAGMETQAERERLSEASRRIEDLAADGEALRKSLGEKEDDIRRQQGEIMEKEQVVASITDQKEKAEEEALSVRQALKKTSEDLEGKTQQLAKTESTLSEVNQRAEEASKEAEQSTKDVQRLEKDLAEEKKTNDELRANLKQGDEDRIRLENEKQEKEKELMEEREARKRAEKDLEVEKKERREVAEKTRDLVARHREEDATRHQETMKRMDDLEKSQTSTFTALKEVDGKIDQMPEMFREGLRQMVQENQKILAGNDLLKGEIRDLVAAVDPEAARKMTEELQSLKATNQKIQEHLATIQRSSSAENMEKAMKALEDLSKKQRDQQAAIDGLAAGAIAKGGGAFGTSDKKGIFSLVNDARLQIDGSLKSKGVLWGHNSREITTYPIAVKANGQVYALSHAAAIGLDWDKISDRLEAVAFSLRTTPTTSGGLGDMYAMTTNCKVLALPVEGIAQLDLYRSISEIQDRALGNLHIFRNSMRSSNIKIEAGATVKESQNAIEFDRTILDRLFASSRNPEPGDFVVSGDGHLVGVMTDWRTCTLILEQDLSSQGSHIQFTSIESYLQSVQAYKSICP